MSRRCSREGSDLGRSAYVPVSFGLVLVALLALDARDDLEAIADSRGGSNAEPTREAGEVRCPDCDDKGRMKCPQCEGKGLLARKCPRCNGTGRRPCTACTEGESASSPGRIVCPACAGDGTIGDGRECPRCSGAQTVACSACLGKGSHSCRAQIFDTVCPTCKFSGKVACTTCGGELWLSPAVLASRKAKRAAPEAAVSKGDLDGVATSSSRATKRRRSSRESVAEEKEAPVEVDIDELRTRFAAATPSYEAHYDLFADDLRFEISTLGDKLKALERKLWSAGAASPLRAELDDWQKRARDFQKRWGELRALFNKEHQAHQNARRVWEARDEGRKELKGYRRELFDREHDSRLRITTEIAETATARLADFQPETLAEESRQLILLWSEYEKRGETELELGAQKAAEEAEKAAEEKKAAEARAEAKREEEKRQAELEARRKRQARQESQRERDERSSRSELSSRAVSNSSSSEGKKVFRSAPEREPEPTAEGGGPLGTVFAVVVGFALASCAFFLKGFWRRRNGEAA